MDRAPVSVAVLLVAAASFAEEPEPTAPADADADATTVSLSVEAIDTVEPVAPAAAPAPSAETAHAPSLAEFALAEPGDDAPPAAEETPAAVPSVEIKKVTDDTVCRKERPTGSLISTTRCYSRSVSTLSIDEQMRRDLEEMRMRQNDQQAREAAAAMTRRRGGL